MIKGITVTLYVKTRAGTDALGNPVYTEAPITVPDVLAAPAAAEDVVNEINLTGRRLAYTLHIPKGDKNNWEDVRIDFLGASYRSFGMPEEWIGANVPGRWNKRVKVERYG